ncbi:laccase-2 [Rhypophila decipiens]|uniref:laccase n=1 Tax=Rhypophila decipiens TaxID=261697 RepID=A0AAN6Y390_9PEZI|nr:laccase-2 [Rhypophila decipiens]
MHKTTRDRYRLRDARRGTEFPPRKSCYSRYKYLILFSVITIITTSIVVPVVFVKVIRKAWTANQAEKDLSAWTHSFNITTDWDKSWPETGITRDYIFTITEHDVYIGPDGVVKQKAMLVNGKSISSELVIQPRTGPVIHADWGDRIQVTVVNQLQANGTSLHWHGFRQLNNNVNDGASGVTECPIPPGGNKTYHFQATQYGTSWYHSHISSQYANGIVGAIHIDGPASAPYDIDLGVFPISDWYYSPADILLSRVMDPVNPFVAGLPGAPPPSDNIIFNGTNVNPYDPESSGGKYARVTFTPGKKHRLRLINTSADNTFTISIVNHDMTIIATDFVPVKPHPVKSVYLTVGQRVDVVIDANQEVATYWLNATFSATQACGSSINPHPAAIVQYEGVPWWKPDQVGEPPAESYCEDDVGPVPVVQRALAPGTLFSFTGGENTLDVSLAVNSTVSKVFWAVNNQSINVEWDSPTLGKVLDGETLPAEENAIEIPGRSQWSVWLVQNLAPIPHPVHLHGHDFQILARSPAPANPLSPDSRPTLFDPATDSFRLFPSQNPSPIRRDTTVLPGFGWLVIAFQVDNPGVWLFHCHIAWHASQGLSVQFLEGLGGVNGTAGSYLPGGAGAVGSQESLDGEFGGNCPAWREYDASGLNPWPKLDSGI